MASFKYAIGSDVTIAASGENGEVVGRAEYAASENSYLVRYRSADGRAMECWWSESALA
ncbi:MULTISPECIES: hypothetical protein [Burkholderia]|uniref:Uncharacterized protein n=1 Tax=Burkholderia aenigmatica TaxID=2015348 RepID=A0A6J5IPL9_9BURK|nr:MULTISPECIES: hypothetical protein [Burkholderia]UKD16833.1 hypothetical protein L3V59_39895 [Burkholderia aenigmatica]CAB3962246.1 hypothetical protein BLA3211_01632 [Burkholderia aenigmatica]